MVYDQYLKEFTPIEHIKLRHMFSAILTNIIDDNDKPIPFIDIYLKLETNRNYVDAVYFLPYPATNINNTKIFNLLHGFEIE
jgi:hypothetical protein